MTDPLVSIVVPTRDRPHLLQNALTNACEQRFDDMEIVVSDNGSTGDAQAVVEGFDDPRLRYVRTPKDLPMPDSWEFALGQARGKFVTYLCDDDAVVPSLLTTLAPLIGRDCDLVMWPRAVYYVETWSETDVRNSLRIPPTSGSLREHRSEEAFRDLLALQHIWSGYPLLLNALCSNRILRSMRERLGRIFFPPAPDYSFAAVALAGSESFLEVDLPLGIVGAAKESIGISQFYGRGDAPRRFVQEFEVPDLFPDLPLKEPTVTNVIAQTLLNARAGGVPTPRALDEVSYFTGNYRDLTLWRRHGQDVEAPMRLLRDELRRRPRSFRWKVAPGMAAVAWRRSLRRLLSSSPLVDSIERRVRPSRRGHLVVEGGPNGFDDIVGSARYLDGRLPTPNRRSSQRERRPGAPASPTGTSR